MKLAPIASTLLIVAANAAVIAGPFAYAEAKQDAADREYAYQAWRSVMWVRGAANRSPAVKAACNLYLEMTEAPDDAFVLAPGSACHTAVGQFYAQQP
jgi:hypothetical protein